MDLVRIDGKYRLKGRLRSGSHSEVYIAHDILSGQDVVIKLESVKGKNQSLEHEFNIYNRLGSGVGIPSVHWFGTESGFNAMVIGRLGLSLDQLFVRCNFQFSVNTVILLASQLICRLKLIHTRNIVHRDLKPSNIVMGFGRDANVAYFIDFGLSKEFRDPRTRQHIPFGKSLGLTGTPAFASINSHLGLELGRRDDLESLAYVLIYFFRGSLPWQGLEFEGHDLVVESKQQISTHQLCKGLPQEFRTFLDYSRLLSFNEKPNYDYLRGLFDNLLLHAELETDVAFDWERLDGSVDEQLCTNAAKHELRSDELKHTPKRRTGLRSQATRLPIATK